MRRFLVLAWLAFLAGPGLAASVAQPPVEWTHFRFDEKHTGRQPFETKLNPDTIRSAGPLWQGELNGELVDYSSPAVAGGFVYIGNVDGQLVVYPADGCGAEFCGQPAWRSTNLAQIMDSPTVVNGIVYVGSQSSQDSNDGKLNAFDAAGCGQAVCAPLWQGDAGTESILQSSPVVWKGLVFVGSFGGKLFAFDADGCGRQLCRPVWTGILGGATESTPVVFKGVVYVGADDGKLYAFNAKGCGKKNCAPLWTGALQGSALASSPAIYKSKIYIGGQHGLSVFDASGCGQASCAPLWQTTDGDNFFGGSPAIAGGRVYLPEESQIDVYDADGCGQAMCPTKAILFGSGMQDGIASSPTVANGVVYAGRNSGEVLAWRADCKGLCDEIWKGFTDDPIVSSSPSVVNGKIYVGGSDHGFSGRLYVFGLGGPSEKRR
ncbi:MAG: PQQ-binding-like beta-propeller repeat protein [Alphaproteobacteria bacterium]|nr:PQQ-binding-like beta-propeller repeat protein [Alphaproteobacteria bacterium]